MNTIATCEYNKVIIIIFYKKKGLLVRKECVTN